MHPSGEGENPRKTVVLKGGRMVRKLKVFQNDEDTQPCNLRIYCTYHFFIQLSRSDTRSLRDSKILSSQGAMAQDFLVQLELSTFLGQNSKVGRF